LIRGVGIDIVEIERIKKLIEKYGTHFLDKVFTAQEIAYCSAKAFPAIHFSGRWAAKEAFYKALPTLYQPLASWKSIEILPDAQSGRPQIHVLSPELAMYFRKEQMNVPLLSISHERSMCTAIVVFE
jgi:holo-[acyl-carrier protein] synthase